MVRSEVDDPVLKQCLIEMERRWRGYTGMNLSGGWPKYRTKGTGKCVAGLSCAIHAFLPRGTGGRIASPGMLLKKYPLMIGVASPNRVGGAHGGNDQHGRAARGFVGGGGALPVGRAGGEGADPRRAMPDDGLASQARGSGAAAARR
jgi:hypothetical protein